ncbi:DUF2891 family protein [Cryobacterium sp. CG_9.6]|uniref:DUF2891 family protein n=1 Tax=Cryobacterium sp. CG_9.6 TaxID=2760710 RepID=UPI0024770A80|nr:DUF2891 family protein [Cryobacterium sp. CG_9.6]MDH6238318.1 hypothetical protein [Cryobacterium sp. CG_9.6]
MTDTSTPPVSGSTALAAAAPRYADIVLENLARPFPHSAHHTVLSAEGRPYPQQIHPAFFTSFDWHSCVHMHYLGVTLLEHGLSASRDAALRAALSATLTPENLLVEAEYLRAHPGWERPYFWAWLLRLAAACATSTDAQIRTWGSALAPAVDVVADLAVAWTSAAEWPVRHGLHTNSAFGLGLMLDAFRTLGHSDAAAACASAARAWFRADVAWPADWELSGQDFLSAGLSEADLMRRVLGPEEFNDWFTAFLPGLAADSRILQPVRVTDESDGYLVHLHGLNLSRAGQVARILETLESTENAAGGIRSDGARALQAALEPLLRAGLAATVAPDFMSTHWLATFAWDALVSTERLVATHTSVHPNERY